jgi:cysteine desulfurase
MKRSGRLIYFDNAASTPLFPHIAEQYAQIYKSNYANPSAAHDMGLETRERVNQANRDLLEVLTIPHQSARVIWTSGGTEANNLAIFGYSGNYTDLGKFSAVCSEVDHDSTYKPFIRLQQSGARVSYARVDKYGRIDFEHLCECLDMNTKLISICHVQSETGEVQDLTKVRKIIDEQSPKAKLHVDAVQAFGKVEIPWDAVKIDLLTLSGHKIHGPGGTGALVLRDNGTKLHPLVEGGGQQHNIRSGSMHAAGIIGFTMAAVRLASINETLTARITAMNDEARRKLADLKDNKGHHLEVLLNSSISASPFILNFSLSGYEGAVLMRMLGERGIIVGTGSACTAESRLPSRILTSMGLSKKAAFGALRLSFGIQNNIAEINAFISEFQDILLHY